MPGGGIENSILIDMYKLLAIVVLMNVDPRKMRVGTGFDVHAFTENRDLILGGVKIPFKNGLKGHSDADVLLHAIIDSLLGASGLGDIGIHFPDSNSKYKDIDSMIMVENVKNLLTRKGWEIINIDSTVICQDPKIAPYREAMIRNIQKALDLKEGRLNIKGTTTEKLGFLGRKEGIAAQAISLLYNK